MLKLGRPGDYRSQSTEFSSVKSYVKLARLWLMSRDSRVSGMNGNPACMASTWGARVKGTSLRSSGRDAGASTVEGPGVGIMAGRAGGSVTAPAGRAGGPQDDWEEKRQKC